MDIYGEFNRMSKGHVADINNCDMLDNETIRSARAFCNNAFKWDSSAGEVVAECLHKKLLDCIYRCEFNKLKGEFNKLKGEFSESEAMSKAKEYVKTLEEGSNEALHNIYKRYNV